MTAYRQPRDCLLALRGQLEMVKHRILDADRRILAWHRRCEVSGRPFDSAASTGRTHDSTDQPCITAQKTLANRGPSTHGYRRTQSPHRNDDRFHPQRCYEADGLGLKLLRLFQH